MTSMLIDLDQASQMVFVLAQKMALHIPVFGGAVQRQDQNTIKRINHSDLVYQYNHVGPAAGWAAASSKAEKLYDMIFQQNQEVHVQIVQSTSKDVGLLLADKAKRCMDHVVALASTMAPVAQQEPNEELVVIETPTLEQFRQRQQQDHQHARSVQP